MYRNICLIPARMSSSRFPGKPLSKINGIPMNKLVYDKAMKSKLINEVYVATCDKEIFEYIKSINGNAVYTSSKHVRASDRCAEALNILESRKSIKYDIVTMIQGDEPMISPHMIDSSIKPLILNNEINVVNLIGKINEISDFKDKNCIKIVHDKELNALYFSRSPIPYFEKINFENIGKQVCVIPFRRDFLNKYLNLEPTPLEIIESIDMLRVLEHGYKVKLVRTNIITFPVDTTNDLKRVENLMKINK